MYRESNLQPLIASLVGLLFLITLLTIIGLAIADRVRPSNPTNLDLQTAIDTVESYVCPSNAPTLHLFEDRSWDCRP